MLAPVTLLAATFTATARAQEHSNTATTLAADDHTFAQKIILPGVSNFGEVNQKLYRGALPSNDGLANLMKMGIGLVVDMRDGVHADERDAVTKLGMEYVAIPWHCAHPDNETTSRFLTLLRENPDKRIFVHCYYGKDRTGMMIAAFRMTEQNWSAAKAKKEMQVYGFSFTHRMMCPGLADHEQEFPSAFKNSPAFEKLRPVQSSTRP